MEHLDETKSGFGRLNKLEAEVLGDKDTKRPSLREEFINALERNRKTMIRIAWSIAVQLAIMFFANYFFMTSVLSKGH